LAKEVADLRARAARFEQRYSGKPSEGELAQLAQASNFTTRTAKTRRYGIPQCQPQKPQHRIVPACCGPSQTPPPP
jgi:hypothetical protein